jgi:hypothetical protein
MESAPICHIDRIPNEILRSILSFVAGNVTQPEGEVLKLTSPSGTESLFQCIFAARWVSRRFRMITNELDFWHDDDFNILDLLFLRSRPPRRQAQYISTLLRDDHLVACLNCKRSWAFSNLESFYEIVARIPDLPRNTSTVILEWFPEGLGFVIYRLATFTAITELQIYFGSLEGESRPVIEIDLDAIAESFPVLRTLELNRLQKYSGTLAQLENLHTLDVLLLGRESISPVSLLPINSGQSLKRLDLCMSIWSEHYLKHQDFAPFVNLAHLCVYSLSSLDCDIIIHGKFALASLRLLYDNTHNEAPVATVLSMFYAPSLEFLQRLDFVSRLDDPTLALDSEVADQLTSALANLRSLEVLTWKMHCRTSWFKRWAPLRNLKSVTLERDFIKFDDIDGTLPDTEGYLLQVTTNRFARRRVSLVTTRAR